MNLVFDLGGVVFRWRPDVVLRETLSARALDDPSAKALAGRFFDDAGVWGDFDRGTIAVDDLAHGLAERCELRAEEARAVIDAVPAELVPLPDTIDLLRRLHARGAALFFLSNMPSPYAEYLERNEVFNLFRDGVFSSRVHVIKPEPEIFQLAALRFGIEPAQSLFIDDTGDNVVAARSQGWNGWRFRDAISLEAPLRAAGCL